MKIGIIGCGRVTETCHLKALAHIDTAEVVALSDIDLSRVKRLADRYNIQDTYADYKQLIARKDIDIVAICVPVQYHCQVTLDVIAAEKHILIEKPLALTVQECDKIIAAANEKDIKVQVGFNLRFHDLVRKAKTILASGELGTIEAVSTVWSSAIRFEQNIPNWRNKHETGGGAIYEIAVHHFDLLRYLLNREFEEIFAYSNSEKYAEQTVTLTAKMTGNINVASIFSERSSTHNNLVFYGTNGQLELSIFQFDGLNFTGLHELRGNMGSRIKKFKEFVKQFPKAYVDSKKGGIFKLSYLNEWQAFINAIANKTDVTPSLTDGKKAVELIIAAIESSKTRTAVTL